MSDTGTWKHRVAWQPDSEATICPCCKLEFKATLRKHHCRKCGRVICAGCSSTKAKVAGYEEEERVCDECITMKPDSSPFFVNLFRGIALACRCIESPETAAKRARRNDLISGFVVHRKRGVLFGKMKVKLSLTEDEGIRCSSMLVP